MGEKDLSIIKIMENALNFVDRRLMNHGRRVAYLTFSAFRRRGKFAREAAVLALMHDIGAYKTEEIDRMLEFETESVWLHSIYGHLFLKYLSPLSHLSPAILFHHANAQEATHLHKSLRTLAGVIYISDRIDIMIHLGTGTPDEIERYFRAERGITFDGEAVDFFFCDGWETLLNSMNSDDEFEEAVYGGEYDDETVTAFMRTIALAIDFRSPQTVTHTFASTSASRFLAERMRMPKDECDRIEKGAMLHDLGKIGIPPKILEKPGNLTPEEAAIMRTHATVTEEIMSGNADERIVRLASRHHEKLNGAGYPRGLNASELTTGERLIAVTDILSALCGERSYKTAFPKEKVIAILSDMSEKNLIDPTIVACAIANYDSLVDTILLSNAPIVRTYNEMNSEYIELVEETRHFAKSKGTGKFSAARTEI